MKIPFHTPGRKWPVAVSATAVMIVYGGLAASQFAASWLGNRVELTSLRRAAWLDPGNADYRYHLGRYYDLVARDPASAVGQYRAAVQLNPHSARYWFDLASAFQVLGDTANQSAALERAIHADSMTPDVAWEAANLYLVQGENEKALREFRVVLANDSSLASTAIQFCWRIEPDVDALLRNAVPPKPEAYVAFLDLLVTPTKVALSASTAPSNPSRDHWVYTLAAAQTGAESNAWANASITLSGYTGGATGNNVTATITASTSTTIEIVNPTGTTTNTSALSESPILTISGTKKELEATAKVWNALMLTNQPFERRHADTYVRYLIEHKEVDQALLVWQQTVNRFGISSYYLPSAGNLIVNGSFNLDLLNAGFDWQYQKQSGVQLTLDPSDSHGGRRSLMITFDGPGISDAGIYQFVPVQPNTNYDFSAYYKTLEQQGAGGPHFTIQDKYSQTVYYESDELKDTGFWKSADGEFTTSADCQLVVVHVRRLPAGSPIRGKLWIDDFHLIRKPS